MSQKFFVILGAVVFFTTACASANTIYTDDIGRMHFMGKGGYSGVRQMQMGEMQAGAVNDAVNKYSEVKTTVENKKNKEIQKAKEVVKEAETDITDVIKEKPVVPAAAHKSTFTYQKGGMDASAPYGFAGTNLPAAGVNESKTIYTDELGRLHFFGKANKIKE